MKLRLPPDATVEQEQLAGEALEVIVKVMRGEVRGMDAPTRRNAAKDIREEICKPIPKAVEMSGKDGGPLEVSFVINGVVPE